MEGSDLEGGGSLPSGDKLLRRSLTRTISHKVGKTVIGCFDGVTRAFRDFILRGNVVDLAVAVVVGNSFTELVSAVVSDWMTPTLAIFFSPEALFGSLTFTVRGSTFPYGHFLNVLLSFVLIMVIVFFLVVLPMNVLIKAAFPTSKTRECPECLSEIPNRASRCKFCCAVVKPKTLSKQVSLCLSPTAAAAAKKQQAGGSLGEPPKSPLSRSVTLIGALTNQLFADGLGGGSAGGMGAGSSGAGGGAIASNKVAPEGAVSSRPSSRPSSAVLHRSAEERGGGGSRGEGGALSPGRGLAVLEAVMEGT